MAQVELQTAEETRARILEVALELIAAQGFAATSTREISERLGFSKAALYYHFRTKDELLDALLAPAIGKMGELVQGAPRRHTPSARRALLTSYVDIVAANAHLMRVLAQDPQVIKRHAGEAMAPMFQRLTHLLAGTDVPDTAGRARVRAALGGVIAVYRGSDADDDPKVLRQVALSSACDALGLPQPRR